MKKIYLLIIFLVAGYTAKAAPTGEFRRMYGEAFIFEEGGVEFAIFPDGQFDFYFSPYHRQPRFGRQHPFSFNDGYNYDPYIQYDDYGAVIQIERVPVFYDYYGRIVQAGNVPIFYNQYGTVSRIGNLFLHYNPFDHYTHYTGFINARNRHYTPRPWHQFYRKPPRHAVVVFHQPYRNYYRPERYDYDYFRNHYERQDDFKRNYYRPQDRVQEYRRGTRTREEYSEGPTENIRSNQNSRREEIRSVRPLRDNAESNSRRTSRDRIEEDRSEIRSATQQAPATENRESRSRRGRG